MIEKGNRNWKILKKINKKKKKTIIQQDYKYNLHSTNHEIRIIQNK